jgi:hypothetical protein
MPFFRPGPRPFPPAAVDPFDEKVSGHCQGWLGVAPCFNHCGCSHTRVNEAIQHFRNPAPRLAPLLCLICRKADCSHMTIHKPAKWTLSRLKKQARYYGDRSITCQCGWSDICSARFALPRPLSAPGPCRLNSKWQSTGTRLGSERYPMCTKLW